MINLSIVTLLSLVCFSISAPSIEKCSIDKCQPFIDSLNGHMLNYPTEKPPADIIRNMTTLCQQTSDCLTPIKCDKGNEYKERYFESCLEFQIRISDFEEDCLPEVFTSVYDNEYNCSKKFDFLTRDLLKKRAAFTSGKSCFLEIAQKECQAPAIDFLKKRYDDVVDVISTKPTRHDKCSGVHYVLNKLQCLPLQLDLKFKMDELKEKDVPSNDTRVLEVVRVCRETEKCLKDNCLFSESVQKDIHEACDVLDLASSSFSACLVKIQTEKPAPDFKKYSCLKGIDIHNEGKNDICEKFHTKADCMKTIMIDFCGKDKMNDYEKMVDLLVKKLKCQ